MLAVNKLVKLNRYRRKKQFKFVDLLKSIKENQMGEINKTHLEAQKLLKEIVPMMKTKVEKLLTDSVDKLMNSVEQQDQKITAIKEVLH